MQHLLDSHNFNGKINIILSSFNHADTLLETLISVAEQSFTEFECVVIDDCSKDDTMGVINSFHDPRFYFKSTGRNPRWCETWNEIIFRFPEESYYAMAHSDDLWRPNKLEKQAQFIQNNIEYVASFSDVIAIDHKGEIFENGIHNLTAIFQQSNRTRHQWLRHFFIHGNCLCHPSALVRTNAIQQLGGYRYNFTQLTDFEMWVRLAKWGNIHVDPEKLVSFRVHDGNGNSSARSIDNKTRHRYEYMEILKDFSHDLSKDDLEQIFPDYIDLFNTKDFIPEFALAILALKFNLSKSHQFFALSTIHDLFKQDGLADLIWDNFQFSKNDLSMLTAKISPI